MTTLPFPSRCLTLLPPWPQAIAYAGKRVEYAAFCILWPKVMKLLEAPARIDVHCPPRDVWYPVDMDPQISCGSAIVCTIKQLAKKKRALRVALLDGTVIREWGAT
jgi:hypothetical protein